MNNTTTPEVSMYNIVWDQEGVTAAITSCIISVLLTKSCESVITAVCPNRGSILRDPVLCARVLRQRD